ncbi:MAG: DUF1887 family CARF protein [Nitrospira sp.]|nr:DUF1887 family CARF protein [Nitrospira sp.]
MLIHVAIVSDQFLPTVIPALMHRPGLVVLIASRKMQSKAERLKQILANHGITAIIRGSAPDGGIPLIRDYAVKRMDSLASQLDGHEVVFNATGGNKLMTLGFVEALRERVDRIIYTDTAHDQIEVINDRHRADPQPEPMWDVLDVPTYLAIQGFRYIESRGDNPTVLQHLEKRLPLTRELARHAATTPDFSGFLNLLAYNAWDEKQRRWKNQTQQIPKHLCRPWQKFLEKCMAHGLLIHEGENLIRFPDEEAVRFFGGGWLEEYTYFNAKEAGLFDVRLGVQGIWEGTTMARNEFDVLACHRNRMLFIECKTGKWGDPQQGNDNNASYKIESLSENIRGVFGSTMLITAQQPTKVLEERASQAKVELIRHQSLLKLSELIARWRDRELKIS